jgi:hypothetical protein
VEKRRPKIPLKILIVMQFKNYDDTIKYDLFCKIQQLKIKSKKVYFKKKTKKEGYFCNFQKNCPKLSILHWAKIRHPVCIHIESNLRTISSSGKQDAMTTVSHNHTVVLFRRQCELKAVNTASKKSLKMATIHTCTIRTQ